MSRLIAIGDIHGCDIALQTLLVKVSIQPEDTVVQLGDVVDRGPNSFQAMELLLELDSKCALKLIVGNHEQLLLNAIDDENQLQRWIRNGGVDTLKSYGISKAVDFPDAIPEKHLEFIRSGLAYFETENFIFTHAGYEPSVEMSCQSELALKWRTCHRDTTLPHCSGKTVVVGHTPQRSGEILDLGYAMCIDTNCYRGGWLTAVDVTNRFFWQANQDGEFRHGLLHAPTRSKD